MVDLGKQSPTCPGCGREAGHAGRCAPPPIPLLRTFIACGLDWAALSPEAQAAFARMIEAVAKAIAEGWRP